MLCEAIIMQCVKKKIATTSYGSSFQLCKGKFSPRKYSVHPIDQIAKVLYCRILSGVLKLVTG